ncbi:MAG: hypothetical protein AB9897_05200 [Anaerolineaceae bacterium]
MKTTSRTFFFLLSILTVLSLAFAPVQQAATIAVTGLNSPAIVSNAPLSIQAVKSANDGSSTLKKVSVSNVFDLNVVQQPSGNAGYVSTRSNTLTQFGMASNYGSIGILAHNYLAGAYFSKLSSGSVITLTFTDGSTKNYTVSSVKKYQALSPTSQYSNFVDVNDSSTTLSSTDMFMSTFGLSGALVLQTCISKNGNSSWGRLFVIAYAS